MIQHIWFDFSETIAALEKDILPAQAVGMKTGIVWSTSPKADYSFLRFEEILQKVP